MENLERPEARLTQHALERLTLGAYNTFDEIGALIEMLERIARGSDRGEYYQVLETGDYRTTTNRSPRVTPR